MRRLKVRRCLVLLFTIIVLIKIPSGISQFRTGNIQKQSYPEYMNAPAFAQAINEPANEITQYTPNFNDELLQDNPHRMKTAPTDKTINNKQEIYYQNKVAVLTYHHLDPVESFVTITPDRFKSHLVALKNNGFHVISIEDFVEFLQKKKAVSPNAVVITFDDGYESVYQYAYPVLKSEGMTATFFLIVSYIEDGTIRTPPILNWKEIIEMHNEGFSFYSHTFNSHETVASMKEEVSSKLTAKIFNSSANRFETESEYKSRIRNDLIKADDILNERLGNKMNLLCLPHGKYNQEVIDIAKQAQISFVFTGLEGLNTDNIKLIKRFNAGSPYMSDNLLIKKLSLGK
ncbi:polysaccharide deacetylase family protein [Paenibacillus aestuarii]|uniref:Polysaccharide deacetylase family protein n=1 Tax=Paenibacillus aestuarii TaxID=516965 RepID=A0ABW0KHL8_9BACL|nr:polysaccharide deacetylase family protein [Paenibacillus aestuarii]